MKRRPGGPEGGQAWPGEGTVGGLGPKISSWNQHCCRVQIANPSHVEPPRNTLLFQILHTNKCAELKESFPVSFAGQCQAAARIHRVVAQKVYDVLWVFRDCIYILLWIMDNASLNDFGISFRNLQFRNGLVPCTGVVGVQSVISPRRTDVTELHWTDDQNNVTIVSRWQKESQIQFSKLLYIRQFE